MSRSEELIGFFATANLLQSKLTSLHHMRLAYPFHKKFELDSDADTR